MKLNEKQLAKLEADLQEKGSAWFNYDWLRELIRRGDWSDQLNNALHGQIARTEAVELTLTQERARADRYEKALRVSLTAVDAALASCPINSNRSNADPCPKCGATSSQNCGPHVTALDGLEKAVRAALSEGGNDER